MGEYPVYDDGVYDGLAAVDDRRRAYVAALREAAPGRVVLDVGTGRDALWAVEAARAGAAHVYAIDASPGAAAAARRAVSSFGGRVTVVEGLAAAVTLPVPAQVCVSEIVGNISSAEGAIPVLNDCRARLCAPDCVWIPFRARTMIAAVDVGTPSFAPEHRPLAERIRAVAGPIDLRLCLGGPAGAALVSEPAVIESDLFDSRSPMPCSDAYSEAGLDLETATGLLLWSRVAAASHGREVDALDGGTRAWAPVYVPVALRGPVRVGLSRRTSDDGVHPDYEITVNGATVWRSPHHVTATRTT